jgi:hypothetical protein
MHAVHVRGPLSDVTCREDSLRIEGRLHPGVSFAYLEQEGNVQI